MLRVLDPNIERLPGTARPDLPEAGPGAFGDQFGGALLAMALLQGMRTRAPGVRSRLGPQAGERRAQRVGYSKSLRPYSSIFRLSVVRAISSILAASALRHCVARSAARRCARSAERTTDSSVVREGWPFSSAVSF